MILHNVFVIYLEKKTRFFYRCVNKEGLIICSLSSHMNSPINPCKFENFASFRINDERRVAFTKKIRKQLICVCMGSVYGLRCNNALAKIEYCTHSTGVLAARYPFIELNSIG